MKKVVRILLLIVIVLFVNMVVVFAHPGRTDSNGCHTCKTNCEKWGLSYGQYHCHNGSGSSSSGSYRSYQTTTRKTTTRKIVYGCTDENAINYNSSANSSDGSCQFENTKTEKRIVYYETEVKGDLKIGKKKVVTAGENGEKEVTIKTITNESGEEVSSDIISEIVTKKPVKEVIEYKPTTKKELNKINNKDNDGFSLGLITIILLVINIIYGNKNTNAKLIINKIRNVNSWVKYILYFLYFLFVIPVFIDIVLIVIYILKGKLNKG